MAIHFYTSGRIALVLTSVLCLVGASWFTYLGLQPSTPKSVKLGQFEIVTPVHDFGEVDRDAVLSTKFRLANGTTETIEITNVAKACSCSEATVEPKVIPPGTDAELTVVWKVGKRRGLTGETIILMYAAGNHSPQPIHAKIAAKVRTVVSCDADHLTFAAEKPSSQKLTFGASEGHAVKLIGGASNHASLTLVCDATTNTVQVHFNPAISGWESGNLAINILTGCPEEPELRFPVFVNKPSRNSGSTKE